jgi:hypothetical protein
MGKLHSIKIIFAVYAGHSIRPNLILAWFNFVWQKIQIINFSLLSHGFSSAAQKHELPTIPGRSKSSTRPAQTTKKLEHCTGRLGLWGKCQKFARA